MVHRENSIFAGFVRVCYEIRGAFELNIAWLVHSLTHHLASHMVLKSCAQCVIKDANAILYNNIYQN